MDTKPIVMDIGVQCDFQSSNSSLMVDASVQHDMGTPLFMSTPLRDYNPMSDSELSVAHHETVHHQKHITFHKKARVV